MQGDGLEPRNAHLISKPCGRGGVVQEDGVRQTLLGVVSREKSWLPALGLADVTPNLLHPPSFWLPDPNYHILLVSIPDSHRVAQIQREETY